MNMLNTKIPYAVELDGTLFFQDKGRLSALPSLTQLKGDCKVMTDFQDAIARTMTVEADTRYVELMISRKLQETGEFDEPVTVITHWKKKRGKNTSDIFFTALPAKRYLQYMELVSEYRNHMVLIPLQSILLSILKKYGKTQPIAAIFQHGRFADVLIGTHRKIWYANRVVAFDESKEQIDALWETVRGDIDTAGDDHHHKVGKAYVVTWIDSGALPEWSQADDPEVIGLDEEKMVMDDEELGASLPTVLHQASSSHAVASIKDKLLFKSRCIIPALNILLLAGALLMGSFGLWHQFQSNALQNEIQTSLRQAKAVRAKVPNHIQPVDYEKTLNFVQRLWSCTKLPTYRQILADVGQGIDGVLQVENIKAEYSDNKVDIKAFGSAQAPFETSYKAYQELRDRILQRGYRLVDDRFDTRINASHFVLQFAKEAQ